MDIGYRAYVHARTSTSNHASLCTCILPVASAHQNGMSVGYAWRFIAHRPLVCSACRGCHGCTLSWNELSLAASRSFSLPQRVASLSSRLLWTILTNDRVNCECGSPLLSEVGEYMQLPAFQTALVEIGLIVPEHWNNFAFACVVLEMEVGCPFCILG